MTVTETTQETGLLPKSAPLEPIQLSALSEQPLVSIIVPSFNQGKYIGDTLDSILSQDYRPLEIVVVDGGSKDETVDVLKAYSHHPELKWTSEPDNGVVHAVNKGFTRVTGEIAAIQSSDDMYAPNVISRVVDEFRNSASTGLIYGDSIKTDATGGVILKQPTSDFSLQNLFEVKTWIPQPSAFFRRELLDTVGGWDDSIPYAPDTDLWIRIAFRTDVVKIQDFLSFRRMHEEQRDTQAARVARDYAKMIEQSPDIAAADPKLRRAAHASKYMFRVRYNSTGSDWYAGWCLLRAAWLCPATFRAKSLFNHFVEYPIRRTLSPVKQFLLGKHSNASRSV